MPGLKAAIDKPGFGALPLAHFRREVSSLNQRRFIRYPPSNNSKEKEQAVPQEGAAAWKHVNYTPNMNVLCFEVFFEQVKAGFGLATSAFVKTTHSVRRSCLWRSWCGSELIASFVTLSCLIIRSKEVPISIWSGRYEPLEQWRNEQWLK